MYVGCPFSGAILQSNLFFGCMNVKDFPIFDGGLFMAGFWPPTFVVPQLTKSGTGTGALRHITPLRSSSLPSASHQQIADPTSSEQRVGEVLKFRSLEIPIYPILLMKGSKMQANSAW